MKSLASLKSIDFFNTLSSVSGSITDGIFRLNYSLTLTLTSFIGMLNVGGPLFLINNVIVSFKFANYFKPLSGFSFDNEPLMRIVYVKVGRPILDLSCIFTFPPRPGFVSEVMNTGNGFPESN